MLAQAATRSSYIDKNLFPFRKGHHIRQVVPAEFYF